MEPVAIISAKARGIVRASMLLGMLFVTTALTACQPEKKDEAGWVLYPPGWVRSPTGQWVPPPQE